MGTWNEFRITAEKTFLIVVNTGFFLCVPVTGGAAQSIADPVQAHRATKINKFTFVSGPATGEVKSIYEFEPTDTTPKVWNVVYDERGRYIKSTDGKGNVIATELVAGKRVVCGLGTPDLVETFDHGKLVRDYYTKIKCLSTYTYAANGSRTEVTRYPNGQKFVEKDDSSGNPIKGEFVPELLPQVFKSLKK